MQASLRMLPTVCAECPPGRGRDCRGLSARLPGQEVWSKALAAESAFSAAWGHDQGHGGRHLLRPGPRRVFQVSSHDPDPQAAAADPGVSWEHNDDGEERGVSCHAPFFISKQDLSQELPSRVSLGSCWPGLGPRCMSLSRP